MPVLARTHDTWPGEKKAKEKTNHDRIIISKKEHDINGILQGGRVSLLFCLAKRRLLIFFLFFFFVQGEKEIFTSARKGGDVF